MSDNLNGIIYLVEYNVAQYRLDFAMVKQSKAERGKNPLPSLTITNFQSPTNRSHSQSPSTTTALQPFTSVLRGPNQPTNFSQGLLVFVLFAAAVAVILFMLRRYYKRKGGEAAVLTSEDEDMSLNKSGENSRLIGN